VFERPKKFPKVVPMATAQTDAISAHVLTAEGEEAAARIAMVLGMPTQAVQHGGIMSARRMAGLGRGGRIVVVEMPAHPDEADMRALTELCALSGRVIALGRSTEISQFRRLLSAGVADYRHLPLDPSEPLDDLLAHARRDTVPHTRQAAVTAVVAASGGAGASLLAANLAWIMAGQEGRDVALIDLDFEFGTLDLDLGLPPTPGLADALAAPDRVDETFLQATMASPRESLRVYSCGSTTPEPPPVLSSERVGPFLSHLQPCFDDVVLDLPRAALTARPDLARLFDRLILVFSPGYGALRSRARIEAQIRDVVGAKIEILNVLSHGRSDARLPAAELKRTLSLDLAGELPNDDATIARAAVQGLPVVALEARCRYARAVSSLAERIEGRTPSAKNPLRSVLGRMF